MERRHRQFLIDNLVDFSERLNIEQLLPCLLRKGVILFTHLEDVMSEKTSGFRVCRLVTLVQTRGPRAYELFCEAIAKQGLYLSDDGKLAYDV